LLARAARFAVLAGMVSLPACEVREVHLVPSFVTAGGGGGEGPPDGGGPPADSGPWIVDSGTRPACALEQYQPELQPLGVYVMVDQSSSMELAWAPVVSALEQFIEESGRLGGVSVGVQYFIANPPPILELGWENTLCDPAAYVEPHVPIAPLPDNAGALVESLSMHGPSTLYKTWLELAAALIFVDDSPTDAALAGAILGARAWHAANAAAEPRALVLLVTDAVPGLATSPVCSATLDVTAAVAEEGFLGTPSISTYVLGVGDRLGDLDGIARAGGTGRAHLVQSNASADILAELSSVRSAALPCEFPADASWLADDLINVELKGAFRVTTLQRVATEAACPSDAAVLAWYASGPERATLCPFTCQAARSTPQASLDVVYGCPTTR